MNFTTWLLFHPANLKPTTQLPATVNLSPCCIPIEPHGLYESDPRWEGKYCKCEISWWTGLRLVHGVGFLDDFETVAIPVFEAWAKHAKNSYWYFIVFWKRRFLIVLFHCPGTTKKCLSRISQRYRIRILQPCTPWESYSLTGYNTPPWGRDTTQNASLSLTLLHITVQTLEVRRHKISHAM